MRYNVFAASRGGPVHASLLTFYRKFLGLYISPLGGRDYVLQLRSPIPGWKIRTLGPGRSTNSSGTSGITRVDARVEPMPDRKGVRVTLPYQRFTQRDLLETSLAVEVIWVREE